MRLTTGQGLFFYRFDADGGDQATFTPAAQGLYHNRNRWYSPALGRFTTKDPNETSLLLITVTAMNGDALGALVGSFDAQGHFADGMNLYLFARGNPVAACDPLGTFILPELAGTWSARARLALLAGSVAGGAGYFATAVMEGMYWRDAAIEAACFGSAAFMTGSVMSEVYFAASQDLMATSASIATGGDD